MVTTIGSQSANATAARPARGVFDDLSDTIFAGHHQPLRIWILCLYFMGLNLSNQEVAGELISMPVMWEVITQQLCAGILVARPAEILACVVECDDNLMSPRAERASQWWWRKKLPGAPAWLKGMPGLSILEKEKPPIFGHD